MTVRLCVKNGAAVEFMMALILLSCAYLLPMYVNHQYGQVSASVKEPAYTLTHTQTLLNPPNTAYGC